MGKEERQKGFNTVKSHHTVNDIKTIAPLLTTSKMLVRIDPWHSNSPTQIDSVIEAGAQIVMLPYWKSLEEVESFLSCVNSRVKTILLLETKEAVDCLDDVLSLHPDEIHIGLNDLHLSYHLTFMFELYSNGVVEALAMKIRNSSIEFGIGGVGKFGVGLLPAPEDLIAEQYRLGSTALILSRSFCNYQKLGEIGRIEAELMNGVRKLREVERSCAGFTQEQYMNIKRRIDRDTAQVVQGKKH